MGNVQGEYNKTTANFDTLIQYGESIRNKKSGNLGVKKLESGANVLRIESAWKSVKGVFSQKKAIEERAALVTTAVQQGQEKYEAELKDFATKRTRYPAQFESLKPVYRDDLMTSCRAEIETLKKMREDVISAKLAAERFAPEQGRALSSLIDQCNQEIAVRQEMLRFYRDVKMGAELGKYVTRLNVTIEVSRMANFQNALDVSVYSSNKQEVDHDKKHLEDAFKELLQNGTYDELRQALRDCGMALPSQENASRIELIEKKLDTKNRWSNLEFYDHTNQLEGLRVVREGHMEGLKNSVLADRQRIFKQMEQENEHLETLKKSLQEKGDRAEVTYLVKQCDEEISLRKEMMRGSGQS